MRGEDPGGDAGPADPVPARSERVLGVTQSSGLGDPGAVQWPLALCLLAAWSLVFLCTLRGIRSTGKVRSGARGQRRSCPAPG